jgi:hypothetical protein
MAHLQFTDVQDRPTEFLDLTESREMLGVTSKLR